MTDRVEKAKKRKRNNDGSSKPSKRVAIEVEKQVNISFQETDKWVPVIASTPGVAISSSIVLKPYLKARRNAPQAPSQNAGIATKELLLHSSTHPKLDYIAREEEIGGQGALLKHYIGVYDPETGRLEVMEARKLVARGSVRSQQATVEERNSGNLREQRNELGQTFGTKKAKKAIASVTENAISPDKSLRAQANSGKGVKLSSTDAAMLSNIAEGAKAIASREELARTADAGKPRPKANVDAENVKDVYTIDNLVGSEVFKLIPAKNWVDDINARKEIFVSSQYVGSRIARSGTEVERLKLLRYINFLLALHSACRSQRGGALMLPQRADVMTILGDIPEAVFESAKRRFADGPSMSKHQVDLMITHICAMACIVDNYEVDMWLLKEDLKLDNKLMQQYFMEIGARIASLPEAERKIQGLEKAAAFQHKLAKLRLPLEFPKVSFGRRK